MGFGTYVGTTTTTGPPAYGEPGDGWGCETGPLEATQSWAPRQAPLVEWRRLSMRVIGTLAQVGITTITHGREAEACTTTGLAAPSSAPGPSSEAGSYPRVKSR